MKKSRLCLAGLILALASIQIVETSFDASSYDLMADVNRDRVVDVNDLSRLGKAYGSSLVLPSITNKMVATVLSFDKEPPEVENARVAIIDPEVYKDAVDVAHTNSSGIATFDLSSNKNYTAIAWSGSAYNYANFTTNSLGEASVVVLLGEPSIPQTHELPEGWVVVSILDNDTGLPWIPAFNQGVLVTYSLTYNSTGDWSGEEYSYEFLSIGMYVLPVSSLHLHEPLSKWGIGIWDSVGIHWGSCVYSPNEDGCANIVVYAWPVPP